MNDRNQIGWYSSSHSCIRSFPCTVMAAPPEIDVNVAPGCPKILCLVQSASCNRNQASTTSSMHPVPTFSAISTSNPTNNLDARTISCMVVDDDNWIIISLVEVDWCLASIF